MNLKQVSLATLCQLAQTVHLLGSRMIFLLFIGAGWYFSKSFSNKSMIGMVYLIFILVFSKSLLRQASQSSLDESSQKESPLLSPDTTCYENLDHYSKSYLKLNDMRKYTELGLFNCSLTTRHPLYIFSFFLQEQFFVWCHSCHQWERVSCT